MGTENNTNEDAKTVDNEPVEEQEDSADDEPAEPTNEGETADPVQPDAGATDAVNDMLNDAVNAAELKDQGKHDEETKVEVDDNGNVTLKSSSGSSKLIASVTAILAASYIAF